MSETARDPVAEFTAAYDAGDHARARALAAPLAAQGNAQALAVLRATEPDRIIELAALALAAVLAALTYAYVL